MQKLNYAIKTGPTVSGCELDNTQQMNACELIYVGYQASVCASSLMLDGIVGELMDVLKFQSY